MNRQINYQQNPAIISSRYELQQLEIKKYADRIFSITRKELDSGIEKLIIPFTDQYGKVIPVEYEDWKIDLDQMGMNEAGKIGGRLDGRPLTASSWYLIWALADEYYNSKGFGVSIIPITIAVNSTGVKGAEATMSSVTKAYRFTVGARVLIIQGAAGWNNGTITSIDSATQMKVLLDNETWGYNLATSAVGIAQINKYRPWKPDITPQETWFPNYRIIGKFYSNSSSNIDNNRFELPLLDTTPIGTIIGLHKNFTGCPIIDPWTHGWQECDGQEVRVDGSPLIGQTLPDLNGDGRFLRGSATSGTLQAATKHLYCYTNANNYWLRPVPTSGEYRVQNTDTVENTVNRAYEANLPTQSATTSQYYTARPINMSVVWIMKVK